MIYLLVGIPASGKSWICDRMKGMKVIRHDDFKDRGEYLAHLWEAAADGDVLAEAPFNAAEIVRSMNRRRVPICEVHVTGELPEIEKRYLDRTDGKKSLPANFRTNHTRYKQDHERFEFVGTSDEVLKWLEEKE